jgi:hypothetical protein
MHARQVVDTEVALLGPLACICCVCSCSVSSDVDACITCPPDPCSIRDEKVVSQIPSEDKEKIEKALHDAVDWLDHNQQAEVREGGACKFIQGIGSWQLAVEAVVVELVCHVQYAGGCWAASVPHPLGLHHVADPCASAYHSPVLPACVQVEEYEHKLKELEDLCNPIITRMYPGAGGAPPGGAGAPPPGAGAAPRSAGGAGGPKIEEVD